MNEYKRAWMAAVDLLPEVQYSDSKPKTDQSTGQTVYDHVKSDIITGAVSSMVMLGLKHAAQSQLKGRLGIVLRTTGRVGVRAVPVLGTAMAIYSIYSLWHELLDD